MTTSLTRRAKDALPSQNDANTGIGRLTNEFILAISMVYAAKSIVSFDSGTDMFVSATSALNIATKLLDTNLNRIDDNLINNTQEFMGTAYDAAGIVYVTSTAIMADESNEGSAEACHASTLLDAAYNILIDFENNISAAFADPHKSPITTH